MVCKLPAVFLVVPGIFLGCTNLKPVQQLSDEARKGMGHFHQLGYSYAASCKMDCVFQKVRTSSIDRSLDCACANYQQADSLVLELFHAMEHYWASLSALASPGLANYDLRAPANALPSSGMVNLSEGEVSALQQLAELAVNAATGQFRSKRILRYMKEADPHVRVLTDKLALVLEQNLLGLLEVQREYWYVHYKSHTVNAALNAVEKEWATEKYYQLLQTSENIRLKVESMVAMLNLIAAKHHFLTETTQKIGDESFQNTVSALSDEIRNLYVVFEQMNE